MTLKTKTALPLNNKKRYTKINIGVKSTLSTDFENNNINAPTQQEMLHNSINWAKAPQHAFVVKEIVPLFVQTRAGSVSNPRQKESIPYCNLFR